MIYPMLLDRTVGNLFGTKELVFDVSSNVLTTSTNQSINLEYSRNPEQNNNEQLNAHAFIIHDPTLNPVRSARQYVHQELVQSE